MEGGMRVKAWLAPTGLLLLALMPILTGALSLLAVGEGLVTGAIAPDTGNYVANPVPIVLHIVAGSLFNLLGVFQFVPAIRRNWPVWHRWSGRVFITVGLVTAAGAIWMNQFFPAFGGWLKYSSNLLFGVALAAALVIAYRAIRRRDIATHRAWMMRAYAIGLGVATQRLLVIPYAAATMSVPPDPWLGLLLWAGWLLNLMVVETILRSGRKAVPTAGVVQGARVSP
jgi:uncharacterized membrane protein